MEKPEQYHYAITIYLYKGSNNLPSFLITVLSVASLALIHR